MWRREKIVVSWNHPHLANGRKSELYNAVNRLAGYDQVFFDPYSVRGDAMKANYETLDEYLDDRTALRKKWRRKPRG
jgi:hypothetical protein